jgi:acyl-coenzyme A thioesterase PaaI-like protein
MIFAHTVEYVVSMAQSNAFRNDIPFIKDLGVEFLSAENGRAVVALDLAPRHLNSWSVAHGGVLMTLLDVAMAVAGRSLDPAAGGEVRDTDNRLIAKSMGTFKYRPGRYDVSDC